jgi:hypothetical protein
VLGVPIVHGRIVTLTAAAIFFACAPVVSAEPGDQTCANYGIQNQVTVYGDNSSYNCQYQYCVQGAGAGAAGASVATPSASSGDVGVAASAGTGCHQGGKGGICLDGTLVCPGI